MLMNRENEAGPPQPGGGNGWPDRAVPSADLLTPVEAAQDLRLHETGSHTPRSATDPELLAFARRAEGDQVRPAGLVPALRAGPLSGGEDRNVTEIADYLPVTYTGPLGQSPMVA